MLWDFRFDFCIYETMFGSSFPPAVCRMAGVRLHVLYKLAYSVFLLLYMPFLYFTDNEAQLR